MKKIGLSLITSMAICIGISNAEVFTLKINGESHSISTNETTQIKIGDKVYKTVLTKNEIQKFNTDYTSFDYLNNIKPSSQDLGAGIVQTMLMTPIGSVIMVQEYDMGIDKSQLYPVMKNQLDSQNGNGMYFTSNTPITQKLEGGIVLEGISYNTKIKGSNKIEATTNMFSYMKNDKTVFIVEFKQFFEEELGKEEDIFSVFWNSLKLKI